MPKAKPQLDRLADVKPKLERNVELETAYHKYYYGTPSKIENTTGNDCWALWDCPKWMGTRCIQFPFDLLMFQEIIWECRPDWIIECGTAQGGTALFLASMCELVRHGTVVSIDNQRNERPTHPGIIYRENSTLEPALLAQFQELKDAHRSIMVILDSDHSKDHVLKELDAYGPLVSEGQYMVVSDTNMNNHPVFPDYGPGPWEAVHEWLPNHHEFVIDKRRERFGISYSPDGWLLRIRREEKNT